MGFSSNALRRVLQQFSISLRSLLTRRSCVLLFSKFWFRGETIVLLATFFVWISTNFFTQFRRKKKERRYAALHSTTAAWLLLMALRQRFLWARKKSIVNSAFHVFFRHFLFLITTLFHLCRTPLAVWYVAARYPLKYLEALQPVSSVFYTTEALSRFLFSQKRHVPTTHYPLASSFNLYQVWRLMHPQSWLNSVVRVKQHRGFTSHIFFCFSRYQIILKNALVWTRFANIREYMRLQKLRKKAVSRVKIGKISKNPTLRTTSIEVFLAPTAEDQQRHGYHRVAALLRSRAFKNIFRLSGLRYWWGGHQGVVLRCSLVSVMALVLRENVYTTARDISLLNRVKLFCRLQWETMRKTILGPHTRRNSIWRRVKRILDFSIFVRSLFGVRRWKTLPLALPTVMLTLEEISAHLSVNLLLVQDKLMARFKQRIRRKFVVNTVRATIAACLINSSDFLLRHITEELRLMKRHFIFLAGFRRILRSVLLGIPLYTSFRLIINGKVGGARRTKRYILRLGPKIAPATLTQSIYFSQSAVETIYGSLGLKLWVSRSPYELS